MWTIAWSVRCRKVEAAFSAGAITDNGGIPLLVEVERRLGLTRSAARYLGGARRRASCELRLREGVSTIRKTVPEPRIMSKTQALEPGLPHRTPKATPSHTAHAISGLEVCAAHGKLPRKTYSIRLTLMTWNLAQCARVNYQTPCGRIYDFLKIKPHSFC